jgi:signal peptidase I
VTEPDRPDTARQPDNDPWLAPEPAPPAAPDGDGRPPEPAASSHSIQVPWPSSLTEPPALSGWEREQAEGSRPEPSPWSTEPSPSPSPEGEPPPPPQRPRRRSRNPVDRLTQGLPDWLRVTIDWGVTILGAVAVVLLVKAYVVNPYRIPSASMEPTLHCARPETGCEARFSDRVLANRFIYRLRDPRRGEIVVFDVPRAAELRCGQGGTFVKRIIGLPGEKIEVRIQGGKGYVYVDGRKLNEPYVRADRRSPATKYGPTTIGPDQYFMMGDNRSSSCDSRIWGTVPRKNLIGKVFATYWPPNRIGLD